MRFKEEIYWNTNRNNHKLLYKDIDIIALINSAIDNLFENDSLLFDMECNERAVAHHLAKYIEEKLNEIPKNVIKPKFVDVEYNRSLEEGRAKPKYSHEASSSYLYPDIILHNRVKTSLEQNMGNNYVAIEVATNKGDLNTGDIEKAKDYLTKYKYCYSVGIEMFKENSELKSKIFFYHLED